MMNGFFPQKASLPSLAPHYIINMWVNAEFKTHKARIAKEMDCIKIVTKYTKMCGTEKIDFITTLTDKM